MKLLFPENQSRGGAAGTVSEEDRLTRHASQLQAGPHLNGPLRLGIGGPVGAGKTTLTGQICRSLRSRFSIGVVTNDIYTREDAEALVRSQALASDRIIGVETGGCPHTAIREDASANLSAISTLGERFPDLDLVIIESGGDNLAATFSPELADLTVYVLDVTSGDDVPRKGGPAISRSDLLVITKIDLAGYVGANLDVMARDAEQQRGGRPTVFTDLTRGIGVKDVVEFIRSRGGLN